MVLNFVVRSLVYSFDTENLISSNMDEVKASFVILVLDFSSKRCDKDIIWFQLKYWYISETWNSICFYIIWAIY